MLLRDIKRELSITGKATDDQLQSLIAGCSAAFARLCARDATNGFGAIEVVQTEYLNRDRERLWLEHWPVSAIASVVENGETLGVDAYEMESQRKLFRRTADGLGRTLWPAGKIVVTYSGGYDLPADCPPDLRDAALKTIKAAWFALKRDPAVKQESVPGVLDQAFWVGGMGGLNGLPEDVAATLANYRNISFG